MISQSDFPFYSNRSTMEDETKLIDVLKTFLEDLNNKSKTSNETIAAIEAENETLRQEKFELLTKLNQHLKVKPSQVALIKSLTSQLGGRKQAQAESIETISRRCKESSLRASEQIKLCKERLRETNNSVLLPYDDVLEKMSEITVKTESNLQKSAKLSEELKNQTQHLAELKNFSAFLKQMEKDQKKQLKNRRLNKM